MLKFKLASSLAPNYQIAEVVQAQRRSAKPPYQILLAPLRTTARNLQSGVPATCRFIKDPENKIAVTLTQLKDLYDLTSAEAKVALCVAGGF